MDTKSQPHDRFARKMLDDVAVAGDFFRNYADDVSKTVVDWSKLKSLPRDYFGEFFNENIVDLLFSAPCVKDGKKTLAFVMVEHKSYPDSAVMLQIGLYLFLTWSRYYKETKQPNLLKHPLPAPVIVVLYHGNEPFEIPLMKDIVAKVEGLERFVPDFSPWFVDLSRLDYGEIEGEPATKAMIEALKRAADKTLISHLGSVFRHFKGIRVTQKVREWVKTILFYADCIRPLKKIGVANALKEVFPEREVNHMTQGLFEELKTEGKAEGEAKAILTFLQARFGDVPESLQTAVSEIRDVEVLEKLIKMAAVCKTLDQFNIDDV